MSFVFPAAQLTPSQERALWCYQTCEKIPVLSALVSVISCYVHSLLRTFSCSQSAQRHSHLWTYLSLDVNYARLLSLPWLLILVNIHCMWIASVVVTVSCIVLRRRSFDSNVSAAVQQRDCSKIGKDLYDLAKMRPAVAQILQGDNNDLCYFQVLPRFLRNSRQIVETAAQALRQDQVDPFFALLDSSFQTDVEILKLLLAKEGHLLQKLPDNLKLNHELIEAAIQSTTPLVEGLAQSIRRNDKQYVLSLLQRNGRFFDFIDEELKKDGEVVQAALSAPHNPCGEALRYHEQKCDKQFVLSLLTQPYLLFLDHIDPSAAPVKRGIAETVETF
jgi:hypothetical protein